MAGKLNLDPQGIVDKEFDIDFRDTIQIKSIICSILSSRTIRHIKIS